MFALKGNKGVPNATFCVNWLKPMHHILNQYSHRVCDTHHSNQETSLVINSKPYIRPVAPERSLIDHTTASGAESGVVVSSHWLEEFCDKRPLTYGVLGFPTPLQTWKRNACQTRNRYHKGCHGRSYLTRDERASNSQGHQHRETV